MKKSKKPKPSFEVARTSLGDSQSGWVYRSDRAAAKPPEPPAPPPAAAAVPPPQALPVLPVEAPHGWIEASVGVMVLPLTIAIVALIAPVLWMLGTRAER